MILTITWIYSCIEDQKVTLKSRYIWFFWVQWTLLAFFLNHTLNRPLHLYQLPVRDPGRNHFSRNQKLPF